MTLDKKEPLYRRVAEQLIRQVAHTPVGQFLPTEVEIAAQLGVSRSTVRDAMGILVDHGLVNRVKRLGTRVIRNTPGRRYVQELNGLVDALEYAGQTIMHIHDAVILNTIIGDPDMFALSNEAGQWLQLTGPRQPLGQSEPSTWSRVMVPGRYAGILPLLNTETPAIYAVIEQTYRIKVARLHHSVMAVAVSPEVSDVLDLPVGAPALQVKAWLYDDDDKLVEYTRSIHDPLKVSMHFTATQQL